MSETYFEDYRKKKFLINETKNRFKIIFTNAVNLNLTTVMNWNGIIWWKNFSNSINQDNILTSLRNYVTISGGYIY